MADPRWHDLLGIPPEVRHPDLYQVLGLDRARFNAAQVERAFLERMLLLDSQRASADRELLQSAKAELQRARKTLTSATERATYDRDLDQRRAEKLRRLVEEVHARGPIDDATERALIAAAVRHGMPPGVAREALRAEFARVHARAERQQTRMEPPPRPSDSRVGKKPEPRTPPPPKAPTPPPSSSSVTKKRSAGPTPAVTLPLPISPLQDAALTRARGATPPPPRESAPDEDTTAATSPFRTLVGTTIDDRYEVLEKVGEGGMGTVFKARHKLLDKLVALKVLNPALSDRADVRERFLREAKAAMEFVHPNAVPLRDFGATKDGLLYMTQDFSHGRSLREILDEARRLPVARALAITRQCLLALGQAHRAGIVHRDVKPENVLIETDANGADFARVCDFGIAKVADSAGSTNLTGGSVIGTPHYMAPEQGAGDKVDARADLYAVGCVLYELVTGEKVFDAETAVQVIMRHVTQAPDPPSSRASGIPRELDQVVLRALEKSPDARFPSADEFVAAIDTVPAAKTAPKSGVGPRPGASTPPRAEPTAKRSRSGRRSSAKHKATVPPEKKKTTPALEVKFCDKCGGSIPAEWKKSGAAKRLGTKLLCRGCAKLIHDGACCMGCFRQIARGENAASAGGAKRLCQACAAKADIMRVCAGCQMILPRVAFEKNAAFQHAGKFFCRECYAKLRGKK